MRPGVHKMYEFFKLRANRSVDFREVREEWPEFKPSELRTCCSKLVHQGYLVRHDCDHYQLLR